MAYTINQIYEQQKYLENSLDFDDMLVIAGKLVKEKKVKLPFKILIIDEFQDTSFKRLAFIETIIQTNQAALCVVGDDYQSIYHFAGCDIQIFLNFQKYFKEAKTYKLQTTYRNSQQLIQLAGKFIMKNPFQIKKELVSKQKREKPVKIVYVRNKQNILSKIINNIDQNDTIFILGRNNFDLKTYTTTNYQEGRIRFLTIHASKGLEADQVIILNLENKTYGFPSQVKDEDILSLVKNEQFYPYEEERRLFYVALTRAKKDVYLLTNKEYPSPFIEEIKKEMEVEIIHF